MRSKCSDLLLLGVLVTRGAELRERLGSFDEFVVSIEFEVAGEQLLVHALG